MKRILDNEFIEPYKSLEAPFGPLGLTVYLRTYSRFDDKRQERWVDTCERVINGNYELLLSHLNDKKIPYNIDELRQNAQEDFDGLFNLRWTPGGRGLWASGTRIQDKHGGALTNCFYVDTRVTPPNKVSYPFCFIFDQLMVGAGVGFSCTREAASTFPEIKNKVNLHVVASSRHPDFKNIKPDEIPYQTTHAYYVLKDSREGWVYALKRLIDAHFKSTKGTTQTLVFDVSDIRPTGSPIKGFGGTASGPQPLVELLRAVNEVLNGKVGQRPEPIDILDIVTLIGECVVAGNVRRSALIALGDWDDEEFTSAKAYDVRPDDELSHEQRIKNHKIRTHRSRSNNTVFVGSSFDMDAYVVHLSKSYGEPGLIDLNLVQNYGRFKDGPQLGIDAKVTGTNPCGEISLESFEPCNLSEIFPTNCIDTSHLISAARSALRYTKHVTLARYPWPETNDVVQRNRRVGVSISGWADLLVTHTLEELESTIDSLYLHLKEYDREYSAQIGINPSIKITTVKPSGSVSRLSGVSCGIHPHPSAYYIKRIEFASNNPLVPFLGGLGFNVSECLYKPRTVTVDFPVKAPNADHPNFMGEDHVPIDTQLGLAYFAQYWWSDNQVSFTGKYTKKDIPTLATILENEKGRFKSLSLMQVDNKEDLKKQYQNLPEEPITPNEYRKLVEKISSWPTEALWLEYKKNNKILDATGEDEVTIAQDECAGGSCPVK